MAPIEEAKASCLHILTCHRELLVSKLRSIRCILDNLSAGGFFCEEDVEIVQQTVTKTDQVEKPMTSASLSLSQKISKIRKG